MAGDWLKFESNLPEKPETLAITTALGWDDPDLTVGKLMRLFRWFDQHTIDGNAAGVTQTSLDRIIGVSGFANAVANCGWLVFDSAGVTLQKFDRHNGTSAKSRAQTAKRVASHRGKTAGNANETPDKQIGNAATVTGALAREEKRRVRNTPKAPKGAAVRFEEFWLAWPRSVRKQDKAKCAQMWANESFDAVADQILADVKAKRGLPKWQAKGPDGNDFIEEPAKYLKNRRWEDGGAASETDWWSVRGFDSRFDAENAGCFEHTASQFRDGARLKEAA